MKIACIVAEGFEDSELKIPVDRLRAAGHDVDMIGTKKGEKVTGKKGDETVTIDKAIDDVQASGYDGVLIPGGQSPDHLRADPRFVEFLKAAERGTKPIFAVCHGPQLLLTAELVRGRTLTAWSTVQGDLRQAGANVVDREVVVDRNWVTSRKPEDLEAFSREALRLLGAGAEARAQVPMK